MKTKLPFLSLLLLYACKGTPQPPLSEERPYVMQTEAVNPVDSVTDYLTLPENRNGIPKPPPVPYYWGYYKKHPYDGFGKQVNSLDKLFKKAEKIYSLDLDFFYGSSLPPEIEKFCNLKELSLRFYDTTALPPQLWELTTLEKLELYFEKETAFPKEVSKLTNLKELIINYPNKVPTELPAEIGELVNLEKLEIRSNGLSSLPSSIGKLARLRELKVYYSGSMTFLPREIGRLRQLELLSLSGNALTRLPAEIGELQKLRELYLDNNLLCELPPEIGRLGQLQKLQLSYNRLTCLPAEIGKLESLTHLEVQQNNLSMVPPAIGELKKLTLLNLAVNRISSLPEEFGGLSALDSLYLGTNQLQTLPASIGNLSRLYELDLLFNPIRTLPIEISKLNSLKWFWVEKKQLVHAPQAVWEIVNRTGIRLSEVPEKIAGMPLSYYLKRNDIDPFAKLYVQGKMSLSTDSASAQILEKLTTNNPVASTFYMYILSTCIEYDSSYCFKTIGTWDRLELDTVFSDFVRKKPCTFIANFKYGPYKEFYPYIYRFANGDHEPNAFRNEVINTARKSCGNKYVKDIQELLPEYFEEGD